ncbi:chlorophyll a-b binding protein 7, chloroplastic [Gossypium australe]|uniref:Chlorophyll a-b binding protein 7, chloroplastic n=1 Tax=Gossypium australe TaxID=47621 RepID=A0A5B6V0W3_9ROSI|nr:chlorophyll a-b binding protein 7, chloroplastic [Gossypium australe]
MASVCASSAIAVFPKEWISSEENKGFFPFREETLISQKVHKTSSSPNSSMADPDRPLWFPGSTPPPWLDGSLPGDFSFDPLGLGIIMFHPLN